MKNKLKFSYSYVGLLVLALLACNEQTSLPLPATEEVTIPYAIVSINQPKNATEASIEIKLPATGTEDFNIELIAKNGSTIPLTVGADTVLANFKLRPYAAQSLIAGESYIARLTYQDAQNNEIKVERNFMARPPGVWKKLPHAPIFGGDYTGAEVLSLLAQSRVAVYQYYNAGTWNVLRYSGKWEATESGNPQPRHGAILFELPYPGVIPPLYLGFGYLVNEKSPDKRSYLPDLWSVGAYLSLGQSSFQVFHGFGSMKSIVKYFGTPEQVFFLKENDIGTMYSMNFFWDEKKVKPFPEKTGSLATFSLGSKGYVINQIPGQLAHLFSYDIALDRWERKADFAGEIRTEASSFSTGGKGYFGLGLNEKGEGLRDVWEYDPAKNQWRYHSEYPGQGHRLLIALSDKNKAYLGWGYENRPVIGTSAKQQVGCTDFWEFLP